MTDNLESADLALTVYAPAEPDPDEAAEPDPDEAAAAAAANPGTAAAAIALAAERDRLARALRDTHRQGRAGRVGPRRRVPVRRRGALGPHPARRGGRGGG